MKLGALDGMRMLVSIRERHANGFVEFIFAVGDADVCVELVMPEAAFAEFCRTNEVEIVEDLQPSAPAYAVDFNWDLHQATHQRFR